MINQIEKIFLVLIIIGAITFPFVAKAGLIDWFNDFWKTLTGGDDSDNDYNSYYSDYGSSNQSSYSTQDWGGAQNLIWSQGECNQLEPYSRKLCTLLWRIQQILYAVGIGLAAVMIIIGGITYMTAKEDEEQVKKAKKTIIHGLIGFAIVLGFALIMGLVRGVISETLL